MKKSIFGLALILLLLGATAGVFGVTAVTMENRRAQIPEARDVSGEDVNAEDGQGKTASEDQIEEKTQKTGSGENAEAAQDAQTGTKSEQGAFQGRTGCLAYESLDAETQKTYEEILGACEQHLEKVELTTLNEDIIEDAYEALTCDYGGLFWVNGYTYTLRTLKGQVKGIDFSPSYTFSQEDRAMYQEQVDETVRDYLVRISMDASDYEKVKYVYEMLIYNVKYNLNSRENQNILSVFLYGESVCSGYANAAQYLLTLLDVPCMTVYGISEGENHAWNLVFIDGEPYYMDVTWGSTVSETVGDCSYAYLNLTSRDMERTHVVDMPFELPACTAVSANYYVQEGRYFTVFDERKVGEVLAASYESGETSTAIKLASDDVYRQVRQAFITDMKAADYCRGLERLSYVENEEMRVLTFLWR